MAELLPKPFYLTPPAAALLLRPLPPKSDEELLVPSLLFIIIWLPIWSGSRINFELFFQRPIVPAPALVLLFEIVVAELLR